MKNIKSKPRNNGTFAQLNIIVPRELYARLSAVSKLRGVGRDDIVVEALESAIPGFAELGAASQSVGSAQPT